MDGQFVDKQSKIQMELVVLGEQKSPTWSWDSLETSVFFCAMRNEHKDLILWTSTCRPFSTSSQRSTVSWIFQSRSAVFDPESNQEPAGVEYSIARTSTYRQFSTSSQRSTATWSLWVHEWVPSAPNTHQRLGGLHDLTGRSTTTSSPEHMPARPDPTTG